MTDSRDQQNTQAAEPGPLTVTITREQIHHWAGRPLTDDEITRLNECIPRSSIPDAISLIVTQFDQDHDDEDRPDPTACQLCGAPGGFPYCTGRYNRTASCAEVVEPDRR